MRYICFNLCADFYSNFAYVIDIGSNFWVVLDICLNFYVLKIYLSLLKVMNPKYVKHMLKLGYYHWPTTLLHNLSGFLYLFSLKNSGWFLTKTLVVMGWLPELPEFHTIFTTNYHVDFDFFFWEQNYYFKVVQLWQPFVSKWAKHYFKVGQSSVKWSDPGHFPKVQGKLIFSFPYFWDLKITKLSL